MKVIRGTLVLWPGRHLCLTHWRTLKRSHSYMNKIYVPVFLCWVPQGKRVITNSNIISQEPENILCLLWLACNGVARYTNCLLLFETKPKKVSGWDLRRSFIVKYGNFMAGTQQHLFVAAGIFCAYFWILLLGVWPVGSDVLLGLSRLLRDAYRISVWLGMQRWDSTAAPVFCIPQEKCSFTPFL